MEGMVTICLHAITEDKEYYFETNTDGYSIAKSPEDMFSEFKIPNDLKAVEKAVRQYYEI